MCFFLIFSIFFLSLFTQRLSPFSLPLLFKNTIVFFLLQILARWSATLGGGAAGNLCLFLFFRFLFLFFFFFRPFFSFLSFFDFFFLHNKKIKYKPRSKEKEKYYILYCSFRIGIWLGFETGFVLTIVGWAQFAYWKKKVVVLDLLMIETGSEFGLEFVLVPFLDSCVCELM